MSPYLERDADLQERVFYISESYTSRPRRLLRRIPSTIDRTLIFAVHSLNVSSVSHRQVRIVLFSVIHGSHSRLSIQTNQTAIWFYNTIVSILACLEFPVCSHALSSSYRIHSRRGYLVFVPSRWKMHRCLASGEVKGWGGRRRRRGRIRQGE